MENILADVVTVDDFELIKPLPKVAMRTFLAILLMAAFLGAGMNHAAEDSRQPNIVVLLADDLGWTGLGCFGSDFYETPHLDALARSGVRFTDAYAACTVCSPTRASIMTGMSPARLHLTDFIAGQDRPFAKLSVPAWTKRLEPQHTTVAEALQSAGYRTGHVGKWHLSGQGKLQEGTLPTDQGFDVSHAKPPGTKGYSLKKGLQSEAGRNDLTDYLTDRACEFISDSKSGPFFLYFAYHVPHTPIEGRRDWVDYFEEKVNLEKTHHNPVYAAMVASLDESVGRVLARLDHHGLTENTVVVFLSDNGGLTERYGRHDGFTENVPLRRGKGSAYEGGVRVPAMVRWPGVTTPGQTCDEPIITTDCFPTFLDIAGIDIAGIDIAGNEAFDESKLDGRNFVPVLRDVTSNLPCNLYWHYPHYHAGGDGPYSAVRSGQYRLIEFHEDNRTELYDLKNDIGEQHDLAQTMPDKASELRTDLHRWLDSVNAQMPAANMAYDPQRATEVKTRTRPEKRLANQRPID